MAKATLETAAWDAVSQTEKSSPLEIARRHSRRNSLRRLIGIKETVEELTAAVKKELDAGYQAQFKI